MRSLLIALLLALSACATTDRRPAPCAGAGLSPCGPERAVNDSWQS